MPRGADAAHGMSGDLASRIGFEPMSSGLRSRHPEPLDEREHVDGVACGIRIRVLAVREQSPGPLDECDIWRSVRGSNP